MWVTLNVNGRTHEVAVEPSAVLLNTLRDLGYTDVKNGCEIGECGACAVLMNGTPVNSCMVLAVQADGADIVTNAGLGTMDKPHIIQEAFADAGAIQCGFCTPGMVISTKALLDRNPDPSEAEIREALSGNLCRCTGYGQIIAAVRLSAERLRDLASSPASSQSEEGGERRGALQSDEQEPSRNARDRILQSDEQEPSRSVRDRVSRSDEQERGGVS
jgi:carbon-monoxide dehydrogenase small subunit